MYSPTDQGYSPDSSARRRRRSARFVAVAFFHRFGSHLNSHVHFQVLVTDGVFSGDRADGVAFHPATELDAADLERGDRGGTIKITGLSRITIPSGR